MPAMFLLDCDQVVRVSRLGSVEMLITCLCHGSNGPPAIPLHREMMLSLVCGMRWPGMMLCCEWASVNTGCTFIASVD